MKKLTIILSLFLFSCKKDKPQPIPEPTCETGTVSFAGTFVTGIDTIHIDFVSNRCPEENSNNYKSDDLHVLLQKNAVSGYTFIPTTYTFSTTELIETKIGESIITSDFTLIRSDVKIYSLNSSKINKRLTLLKVQ